MSTDLETKCTSGEKDVKSGELVLTQAAVQALATMLVDAAMKEDEDEK